MQVFVMPMRNDFPSYTFKSDLTDVIYTINVRFNTRMQRWIIDVLDASGNPIVVGLPVLLEVDLYGRFVRETLPAGKLIPIADTLDQPQPTRNSFGNTHSLLYVQP